MEPLTKEKLDEVKKFADDFGFKTYIGFEECCARFEVALFSANIYVTYEPVKLECSEHRNVGINWTSCEGGWTSIAQTKDFIKFMGYAVQIADKLKED